MTITSDEATQVSSHSIAHESALVARKVARDTTRADLDEEERARRMAQREAAKARVAMEAELARVTALVRMGLG